MSAFYSFLSSLYNCLLKSIPLIILLGEVLKISGDVPSHPRGGAHLSPKSGLGLISRQGFIRFSSIALDSKDISKILFYHSKNS